MYRIYRRADAESMRLLEQHRKLISRSRSYMGFNAFIKDQDPAMVVREADNPGLFENGAYKYLLTHQRLDRLSTSRWGSVGVDLVESALSLAHLAIGWRKRDGLPWERAVVLGAGSSFDLMYDYLSDPYMLDTHRVYGMGLLRLADLLPQTYPPADPCTRRLIRGNTEAMEGIMPLIDAKEKELGVSALDGSSTMFVLENHALRAAGFGERARSLRAVAKAQGRGAVGTV